MVHEQGGPNQGVVYPKGADRGGGLLCILNGVKDIMITKLSG